MKISNQIFIALLSATVVTSCSKDDDFNPDVSNVKIASVSGVGDFKYEGNRLVSIGNEQFYYGSDGKLTGSRIFQVDTSRIYMHVEGEPYNPTLIERLERSSFHKEGDKISMRMIDSLQTKSYSKLSSANPLDPSFSYSLTTGVIAERFFYKGDLLDSISRVGYSNQIPNYSAKFFYNPSGDIVKILETVQSTSSGPFGYGWTNKSINEIEITYDDKPNPFYFLFKQTGVVVDKVKQFYFSKHNPVLLKLKMNMTGQTPVYLEQQISYEYSKNGLPLKIRKQTPLAREQVIAITYK